MPFGADLSLGRCKLPPRRLFKRIFFRRLFKIFFFFWSIMPKLNLNLPLPPIPGYTEALELSFQEGWVKEPPVLHAASHCRETLKPDPAVLGLMVLRRCLGHNLRVYLERWRANLYVSHTAGTALSPAAFDACLNSKTSPGPRQGFSHLGLSQARAAGLVHGKSSETANFNKPIPLTGAGSWHFLPTLHPSGSLPAFGHGFPGNSTRGDRRGEAVLPRSGATRMLTHVPHGDGTDSRSLLHLLTEAEASSLTDFNGTGVGVLWPHHHARIWGIL